MNKLPYPTWDKYPSPKQVYAAFGHTYVGYIPSFPGLMRLDYFKRSRSDYLTKNGALFICRFAASVNITSLEMRIANLRYIGHVVDSNITYSEKLLPTQYFLDKQPRYQVLLFDTVLACPRNYASPGFYMFEDFIINASPDILLWAKYAKVAPWTSLESLEALPKREKQ